MTNYARPIARDQGGAQLDGYPAPDKAIVRWNVENQVASSVINLNSTSTGIEIMPTGAQGAKIRWVPVTETAAAAGAKASVIASGLGANFDHHIQPSTMRRFIIPKETQGQMPAGGLQVGSVNGLYQRLAWINANGVTSILAVEY